MNILSIIDVKEDMVSRRRNFGLRSKYREESEKLIDIDIEVCKRNVERLKDIYDRSEIIIVILNLNRMEVD